jgi:small subunit ribosomal protein S15
MIEDLSKTIHKHETMALLQERKQEIISEYQVHETDTGSADLQVAMLTDRINKLSTHLQSNKKDYSSRRGLLKMIGRRKRLLSYIQKQDAGRYRALITRLGIRG